MKPCIELHNKFLKETYLIPLDKVVLIRKSKNSLTLFLEDNTKIRVSLGSDRLYEKIRNSFRVVFTLRSSLKVSNIPKTLGKKIYEPQEVSNESKG